MISRHVTPRSRAEVHSSHRRVRWQPNRHVRPRDPGRPRTASGERPRAFTARRARGFGERTGNHDHQAAREDTDPARIGRRAAGLREASREALRAQTPRLNVDLLRFLVIRADLNPVAAKYLVDAVCAELDGVGRNALVGRMD